PDCLLGRERAPPPERLDWQLHRWLHRLPGVPGSDVKVVRSLRGLSLHLLPNCFVRDGILACLITRGDQFRTSRLAVVVDSPEVDDGSIQSEEVSGTPLISLAYRRFR